MKNKLHLFYKVRSVDGDRLPSTDLYAFTDKDDLAEEFQSTRSNHVFYHKLIGFDDRKDLLHFIKNTDITKDLSTKRLVRSKFNTRLSPFSNKIYKVPIVITAQEEWNIFVTSDKVQEELSKLAKRNLHFVKDDYLKYLNDILYFQMYKYQSHTNFYFYSGIDTSYDETTMYSYHVDEYRLFLYLYGGTFQDSEE